MGGRGSGGWYRWNTKDTTEGQHSLDVRWMHRRGMLRPGWGSSVSWSRGERQTGSIGLVAWADRVELRYRSREAGGEWEDVTETVQLDRTPCHYGGERVWFRCPRCGRRVAVLYGPGRLFLCRRCYGLAYESQREGAGGRAVSRMQAIRRRLGGEAGLAYPFPEKPKGMHWQTYTKLLDEYLACEQVYEAALYRLMARIDADLARRQADLDAARARRGSSPTPT